MRSEETGFVVGSGAAIVLSCKTEMMIEKKAAEHFAAASGPHP
jgi:hypothetical protein